MLLHGILLKKTKGFKDLNRNHICFNSPFYIFYMVPNHPKGKQKRRYTDHPIQNGGKIIKYADTYMPCS